MLTPQHTTVLLVHRDAAMAAEETAVLKDLGYDVVAAPSGRKAIELLREVDAIRLVVLDVDLVEGTDAPETARRILDCRSLPIVLLLRRDHTETAERAQLITSHGCMIRNSGAFVVQSVLATAFALFEARRSAEAALEKLRESEGRYRSILDASPDDITITDLDGRILMISPAALTMFGVDGQGEWLGRRVSEFLVPEDPERAMSAVARLLRGEKTVPGEYRGMRTDGSLLDIEVHSQLIRNAEGQPNSMMIIVRDITKRKRSEERITTLLAEKELLLKEVHHRIKNNMNTVKALLSLQGSLVKDPVAVAALKDAGSRVQSMMQLYDKLYRSEGFTSLPTDDYLSTLLDEIIGSFPNRESVRVEKHLDPIVLDARRMSSLGMVVNELITNIMKYAFVGRDHGLIAVSASLHGKRVRVMVRDDGIGMPDMLDPKRAAGFGLKLVDMLTEQLEGTIHAAQDTGTVWILEFDL